MFLHNNVYWKSPSGLIKVEVVAELPYATIPKDDGDRIFKIKIENEILYVYKKELQFV